MQFTSVARDPGDFHQPLTPDQILAVCARAFGHGAQPESARELSGGEFNTIYRVALANREPLILRVAPPPSAYVPWHEADLMHKEHAIQPYLAPIAPLIPRTVMVDFTHQVIPRDYLFQTFMPGERWESIADALAPAEDEALWRELARIARLIHSVRGEAFGHPYPGRQFPSWSLTLLDWLARALLDVEHVQLDTAELRALLDIAAANTRLLDEIAEPRLLHGDLWPFNVLIERHDEGPAITAVLDYDRAAWGDPLADWTFNLLPRRTSAHIQAIFWEEYGAPPDTPSARFRAKLYEGLHAGNVLSDLRRRNREDLLPAVKATLRDIVADLRTLTA